MKIEYNKSWKPYNLEYGVLTDEFFDKRFEIDRQFIFKKLFHSYWIRFVKYPNNNKIYVHGTYIINIPKFLSFWIGEKIFKKPYSTICRKIMW